ncbi:MAG: HDIG domain-containing protein [Proteobacteria bacterium]|nr:HDIG domain-containing protein [Pseudomonadota bacterium]
MTGKDEKNNKKPPQPLKKELPSGKDSVPFGNAAKALKENSLWQKRAILIVISILSALILSLQITAPTFRFNVGDIARQNFKASSDLLVEDEQSTMKKKEVALSASLDVYDFDDTVQQEVRVRIQEGFSLMRENLKELEDKPLDGELNAAKGKKGKYLKKELVAAYLEESRSERLSVFKEKLGVDVGEKDFKLLESKGFERLLEEALIAAVLPVLGKKLIDNKELLPKDNGNGIVVRNIKSKKETIFKDFAPFIDVSEAKSLATKTVLAYKNKMDKSMRASVLNVSTLFFKPTLTFNKNESEERKKAAVDEISPVFIQIKEGEMILREGERVSEEQIIKLKGLISASEKESNHLKLAGLSLLVALILYTMFLFATQNIRKIRLEINDLLFLGILFVVVLAICRLWLPISNALAGSFPFIPTTSYQYFFTAAVSAMLVRIVLNSEVAIVFSMAISLMVAIIMKDSLVFGIYAFVGCIVGAQSVRFCKTRVSLIKSGFYVGIANAVLVLIFGMAYGELFSEATLFSMLLGFAGGVVTGVVVTGIVPIVEGLFGYTTNFNLLELASLDHPLLKELITQAPGTYHHSWIIGNLVESAAKAINANPLFARVSSLYHDIGKMKKPQYFFENQKGEKNPHDKLSPNLSSLIVIGHVKDGLELAKEYKLGKRISDIIPQHHGTRLIKYFYNKAKEQEDPDVHTVDEKDFRYPGPKPQTKEAGLVMLADAVEAACRTITDPTKARIKSAVQKIIGDVFADGQLDECELTLKDLNLIAQSFNNILNGIYHARIDYPEPVVKEDARRRNNDSTDRNSKENKRGKKRGSKENGEEDSRIIKLQRSRT